jgi:hypothetical protein
MSFFPSTNPIIRPKQKDLDFQDLKGLWKINLKLGKIRLYSRFYTRIDQVFLLWGLFTFIIFAIAQFLPISWITQAYLGSVLTVVGGIGMIVLSYCWSRIEGVTWIVYWWTLLILVGMVMTNLGIFWGVGIILANLCPLWLGLSALGYWGTGIGLGSRSFILAGFVHLLSIFLLPYVPSWQFLTTGGIIGGILLLFAEIQWDMRPPIESNWLTPEQVAFNLQQARKRQISKT